MNYNSNNPKSKEQKSIVLTNDKGDKENKLPEIV